MLKILSMIRPLPVLLIVLGALAHAQNQQPTPSPAVLSEVRTRIPAEQMRGYNPQAERRITVYQVDVSGVIDLGLTPLIERVVRDAEGESLIMLRIKTDGGRVDGAVRIREALLDADVPVIAYIDRRAISAGALIALAADTIIMSEAASFGDAMPIQAGAGEPQATSEKVVSYMRSIMRATAEAKGRRGDLAEAMVDPDIAIEGIIEEGKLLTLASDRALELEMAEAIVPHYRAALELLNLQNADVVEVRINWGEQVARWLTHPVVSSLLMTFGFLGLLLEFYTPGFGVGGIIGASCLFLFFFGQYAANLAGWEEVLLFVAGVILLMVEIFVIPGFGIAGGLGIALMLVALVLAMIDIRLPLDVSFELGYLQEAISLAATRLAITLVVVIAAAILLGRRFSTSAFGRLIILKEETSAARGYVSTTQTYDDMLGKRGNTVTVLRPQGTAEIDGKRYDVASDSGFIDMNEPVEVVQVEGTRIVVRKIAGA